MERSNLGRVWVAMVLLVIVGVLVGCRPRSSETVFARGEKVPLKFFTNQVWLKMLHTGAKENLDAQVYNVTFAPSARTHWIAASELQTGPTDRRGRTMKVKIIVGNKTLTATMQDHPTARDFVSLLPLTLRLKDYAGKEKVSDLPRKLSLKDAPAGSDPSIGDITYYSPWGNLALFYKEFPYASGLVILGKLDGGLEVITGCKEPCTVRIER